MNVVYSTGALRKFLDARSRGVSGHLLQELKSAALADLPPRSHSRVPAADRRRSVVLDFDAARARLERSWDAIPE
jgi:hypothetical protein